MSTLGATKKIYSYDFEFVATVKNPNQEKIDEAIRGLDTMATPGADSAARMCAAIIALGKAGIPAAQALANMVMGMNLQAFEDMQADILDRAPLTKRDTMRAEVREILSGNELGNQAKCAGLRTSLEEAAPNNVAGVKPRRRINFDE